MQTFLKHVALLVLYAALGYFVIGPLILWAITAPAHAQIAVQQDPRLDPATYPTKIIICSPYAPSKCATIDMSGTTIKVTGDLPLEESADTFFRYVHRLYRNCLLAPPR